MQRKHFLKLGFAGALVFAAAAHAKPELTVDAAGGVDLSKYKTYSWVKTNPPPGYNSVRYQRALENINARMAAKGYRHVCIYQARTGCAPFHLFGDAGTDLRA